MNLSTLSQTLFSAHLFIPKTFAAPSPAKNNETPNFVGYQDRLKQLRNAHNASKAENEWLLTRTSKRCRPVLCLNTGNWCGVMEQEKSKKSGWLRGWGGKESGKQLSVARKSSAGAGWGAPGKKEIGVVVFLALEMLEGAF